jgi:hypothetical protein
MRGRQMNELGTRAAAVAGLGALLFTVGCGASQNGPAGAAQSAAAAQPGASVVVGCEPNQRTLVRPTVVNGVAVSQVDCVSNGDAAVYAQTQPMAQPTAVPVSYYAAPRTVAGRNGELGDTRIIPAASYPATAARPVRTQQVVYDDPPARVVKRGRSVTKSAVIIGSSAGIGAGVGAAIRGKKGALIGAAISGGGAAIWDQMTRRKN